MLSVLNQGKNLHLILLNNYNMQEHSIYVQQNIQQYET